MPVTNLGEPDSASRQKIQHKGPGGGLLIILAIKKQQFSSC